MNVSAQPLVSIVTPVYNTAEYLRDCIESVLAQTYQNWEYTIVDNCSTDGSSKIAHEYAARNPKIRVFDNPQFLSALANHNTALRQISPASKYCKVVFGDDWLFPECLEKMVAVAEANPSVGLVGAYCLEGEQVICTGLPYTRKVVSGREICRQHLLNRLHLFGSANSVLYRCDLVRSREHFYDEANIHADTEVCFALLRSCDFGFVHQVLTFTRIRPGSLNTVSAERHSYFGGMLQVLGQHGAYYLTQAELDAYRTKHLAEYYRFLGKCLWLGRDKAFWDYHKNQLKEAGLNFSRPRLFWAALGNLGRMALSPGVSLEKLIRARKQRALASF